MGDTIPDYVKNADTILNTSQYTNPNSSVYNTHNSIKGEIQTYSDTLSGMAPNSISSVQDAESLHNDINTNTTNIAKLGVDVYKYYGKGQAAQAEVANANASMQKSSTFLNNQVKDAQKLRQEILKAEASREADKLQAKSYWLQSLVLLVILLIFVWRLIAATYSDKTGTLDLIMAVISILVLISIYWNSITAPIANYWNYLKHTFFNINI